MALFDQVINDTAISISELLALASAYQFNLSDSLGLLDSTVISLTGQSAATDNVTTTDILSTQMSYAITVSGSVIVADVVTAGLEKTVVNSDTVAVSDTIAAGRERNLVSSDTLSVLDAVSTSRVLNLSLSDLLATPDFVFAWVNGSLAVNLTGSSTVTAVLIKKASPFNAVVVPPPRTVALSKPSPERISHNVVNVSPVRRRG